MADSIAGRCRGRGHRRWRWRDRWAPGLLVAAVAAVGAAASTGFDAPPRYDGASYAMLARSLAEGLGYRDLLDPEAPPHVHFPPGYPALLAATWAVAGESLPAAHAASILCTAGASAAGWWWFRLQYPRRVALLLGLALAMNWAWHRVGGSIQSEPLYLLLQQLALIAGLGAAGTGGARRGAVLGLLLGLATLTRHIGATAGAAIGLDLVLRRRWRALAAAVAVGAVVVAPWVGRQARSPRKTQLEYFPGDSLPAVVAGNLRFYGLRIPDALAGPYVEVGTVFATRAYPAAAGLAALATAVVAAGLVRSLRSERRRQAGLVVALTLALLLAWPFTEAGRFLGPLVPALLVLAAEGLAAVAGRLGLRRPRTWAAAALLLAATPYATYAAVAGRAEVERRSHAGVDAALGWIAGQGDVPGPIMTAYPAESYWFTGRPGLGPPGDPGAIAREVDRLGVAYLVVVEGRFARAADDPLSRFVAERPDQVRLAWSSESGTVAVFEALRQ